MAVIEATIETTDLTQVYTRLTGGTTVLTEDDHGNSLVIIESGSNVIESSGIGTFGVTLWNRSGQIATVFGVPMESGTIGVCLVDGSTKITEFSQKIIGGGNGTGASTTVQLDQTIVRLSGGTTQLTEANHSNAIVILQSGANVLTSSGSGSFGCNVWNRSGQTATVLGKALSNNEIGAVLIDGSSDAFEASQQVDIDSIELTQTVIRRNGGSLALTQADHSNAIVILQSGANTLTSSGIGTFGVNVWNRSGQVASVFGQSLLDGEIGVAMVDGSVSTFEASQDAFISADFFRYIAEVNENGNFTVGPQHERALVLWSGGDTATVPALQGGSWVTIKRTASTSGVLNGTFDVRGMAQTEIDIEAGASIALLQRHGGPIVDAWPECLAPAGSGSGGGGGSQIIVSGEDGRVNVRAATFGATGDGSSNDTSAIQAAIDATPNDGVVYFPPGRYLTSTLNVPHGRAIKFQGASPWATTLVNRTAGNDIFKITDPGGAGVQDRFNRVHVYQDLGFVMNTGSGSPDLTTGLNRCTTAGFPVGPCCIAYVTDFVPTGTGNPGINATWLHSFGVVQNCVANVTNKHGNHGCGLIHHGANHYGWTYQNIWVEGLHYVITDSLPYARRVTADSGSNRLTVQNGTNPFQNGQMLYVAAHQSRGAMPGGINRFQRYYVVGRNSNSFLLANSSGGSAINLSNAGSGSIYVYGAHDFAGEYAPDGISIDRVTHYAGRCPISLTNTENLHIGRVDSYGMIAALHLHAVESLNRKQHIGVVVDAYYSESPQSADMPNGEDAVHINTEGGHIGYLQIRGETPNNTRPPVRLKGRGYRVAGLDLISSFSQAQPDIIIDGDAIGLYGRVHTACGLQDNGTDNHYLLTRDSGGWKFRKSPY